VAFEQCFIASTRLKLRQGGTAQNVAIHKYFYERSDYWKDIREEASRLDSKATQDDADMGVPDDDDDDLPAAPSVQLGAFDDRHLSSLPIVRARIIELLSKCTNNVHSTRNLLVSMVSSLASSAVSSVHSYSGLRKTAKVRSTVLRDAAGKAGHRGHT
jgi:hypothetical protein